MRRKDNRPLKVRFEDKIYYSPDGCWYWVGCADPNGYGKIQVDGRQRQATRVSHELYKGPIPDGMFICHKCDNPPCVNPDHLYAGTHQDNMNDMKLRCHRTKGEKNYCAKLSNDDIIFIRQSEGVRGLARRFKVSHQTIFNIKKHRRWTHI